MALFPEFCEGLLTLGEQSAHMGGVYTVRDSWICVRDFAVARGGADCDGSRCWRPSREVFGLGLRGGAGPVLKNIEKK